MERFLVVLRETSVQIQPSVGKKEEIKGDKRRNMKEKEILKKDLKQR